MKIEDPYVVVKAFEWAAVGKAEVHRMLADIDVDKFNFASNDKLTIAVNDISRGAAQIYFVLADWLEKAHLSDVSLDRKNLLDSQQFELKRDAGVTAQSLITLSGGDIKAAVQSLKEVGASELPPPENS